MLASHALTFCLAGAALAQSLPNRDDPRWEAVGWAAGARYFVLPDSFERDGDRVQLIIKAFVAPSSDDGVNVMVVRVAVDCAASTIGVGARDMYREARGFDRTFEAPIGALAAPSDPGQTLIIQRACRS